MQGPQADVGQVANRGGNDVQGPCGIGLRPGNGLGCGQGRSESNGKGAQCNSLKKRGRPRPVPSVAARPKTTPGRICKRKACVCCSAIIEPPGAAAARLT